MKQLAVSKISSNITVHGKGEIGGKGAGLALVDQMKLHRANKLRTEVFSTALYERYIDNSHTFDHESLEHLREVHGSFAPTPIGVRASERFENDPYIPTSGESSSYMLPNHHPDPEVRFNQFLQAIRHIYDKFSAKRMESVDRGEGVAFLINPIPGVASNTNAGTIFYPMSSGVADSFFKHPLNLADGLQDPTEGFARVAFGHGYAVVRDDFEVIPLATIKNPIRPRLMSKDGQQFFYAIGLEGTHGLSEDEMSTMATMHMRFSDPRIRTIFQDRKGNVNFDRLLSEDHYGYRSGLTALMDLLRKRCNNFQIEFTWNVFDGRGVFHIVQYKELRDVDLSNFHVPGLDRRALVSTDQFQGHGVIEKMRHSVVINPFRYSEEMHDDVLRDLQRINAGMKARRERYVLVCPGRIGTTNRKWGFNVDYGSISSAAAIIEYGYDIKGSSSIVVERDEMTGGIYGSHFLYQILGGADEAERRRRARMFGSQGTHFLTNLYTSGALYLFINPSRNYLSKWFFIPPEGKENAPLYLKKFEQPMTAYANLFERKCLIAGSDPLADLARAPTELKRRPRVRVLNPQKLKRAFIFAASDEIRDAARLLDHGLPYCKVRILTDPTDLGKKLYKKTFVLFVDEGAIPFLDRAEFKKSNPFGTVVLLTTNLEVGCAPTKEEVQKVAPLSKKADLVFYINDGDCHPSQVMPAAVRYAEDKHNIEYHKRAKRFIFLVVDDELRWFSQFLPVLYRIIGLRAGVMLARTYEEAQQIMNDHGGDIVCLITDMYFPKDGVVTADAGRELVISTRQTRPRIPIIIASKGDKGAELQDIALILPKGSEGAMQTLDKYVHDFTGLGDFLFFEGKDLWRRVSTLAELRDAVVDAPIEMLEEYASKDYFSTWLYMHGFRRLGDSLRERRDHGAELKNVLVSVFNRELKIVEEQQLVLVNGNNETVGKITNIEDLARVIETIDYETLKAHSANDMFSMWLMIKGYPELADQIRPIHGEGEELRSELVSVIRRWLETNASKT